MNRRALIFSLVTAVALLVLALNSLRRPSWAIQESLKRAAPLGSSKEEVQAMLAKKDWRGSSRSTGFLKQVPGRPFEVVGTSSIDRFLGDYGLLFRTSVEAFWGFDANGKLIEVWVWKTTDAL